jgi:hypothetical protein
VETTPCDDHRGSTSRSIFCVKCGKEVVPGTLKTVRIGDGFTGPASTNPNVEHFWETGDPSRLRRPKS